MAAIAETLLRDILRAVGGPGNVAICGNCMTRLRLTLVNAALADSPQLKQLPSCRLYWGLAKRKPQRKRCRCCSVKTGRHRICRRSHRRKSSR